jgi:restriction endonuclease S subunit
MLDQQKQNLEMLKYDLIKLTIENESNELLSDLYTISHTSNKINTIQINKNSNIAGNVSLTNTESETSTNMYYLHPIDEKTNTIITYYLLKYFENDLITISNSRNTIQLPKNKLENLQIPVLSTDKQNEILKCVEIDKKIKNIDKLIEEFMDCSIIGMYL